VEPQVEISETGVGGKEEEEAGWWDE